MRDLSGARGVLYLVVCAAPAAARVHRLVIVAQRAGWRVLVIASPMGVRFLDVAEIERLTGEPVRYDYRMPGEEGEPAPADAVVVAPATFNTVNKWAAGIADTFAVGLLCELTGVGLPILAVPLVKPALAAHVAFGRSLHALRGMGVRVLVDPAGRMPPWEEVLRELHRAIDDREGPGDGRP
ncbi:flavoprotein [Rhizohabitans arisaemae]|uniref:flavoprotein n=1 Tax=Rhizohabitans arisaemae TaxID=2720610 RepID=UPI0024B135F1|nr:flavoprotein [Rhizohabitans arisaemae]